MQLAVRNRPETQGTVLDNWPNGQTISTSPGYYQWWPSLTLYYDKDDHGSASL